MHSTFFRSAVMLAGALALGACRQAATTGEGDGSRVAPGPGGEARATQVSRPAPPPRSATPAPRRSVVVPEGTELHVELQTGVSSGSNHTGDLVVARLTRDVRAGGRVALPEGSEVRGRVTAAVASGRVKGRARLAVAFERVQAKGRQYDIAATRIDVTAGSTVKRDAAMVGGGAVAGAVIDGKKGAGIGALLGGGAVLATKGKEVAFAAGTPVTLRLTRDLTVD